MAVEREVKFAVDDLDAVRSRLQLLGAKLLGTVHQHDVYLQHPCKDLAASDEALRVRASEVGAELTYKGPRKKGVQEKVREELTVRVSEPETLIRLFERLGFSVLATVDKAREVYEYQGVKVCLDVVRGLGNFVEIEGEGDLLGLAAQIGIRGEPLRETYLEMVLKRRG